MKPEIMEKYKRLLLLPRFTVIRKGKTERILHSYMPGMIAYMTRRSKRQVTGVLAEDFIKWANKDAVIVYDDGSTTPLWEESK